MSRWAKQLENNKLKAYWDNEFNKLCLSINNK